MYIYLKYAAQNQGTLTILFYDGDCSFCNRTVRFILDHERTKDLRFSPLQSSFAEKLLQKHAITRDFSTIIVYHRGKFYRKSKAVFLLASFLRQPYALLGKAAKLIPTAITDWGYDIVAKYRKRLFEDKHCSLPEPVDRRRFIHYTAQIA